MRSGEWESEHGGRHSGHLTLSEMESLNGVEQGTKTETELLLFKIRKSFLSIFIGMLAIHNNFIHVGELVHRHIVS